MAKRKTNQYMGSGSNKEPIQIEQAMKNVKAMLRTLKYRAKKNNWRYSIIVVISEHEGGIHERIKIIDGVGRPKTKLRTKVNIGKEGKTELLVNPHIHILIKANPGATVINFIKNYWEKRYGSFRYYTMKSSSKTDGHGYNHFKEYAIPQATSIRKDSYGYVGNFI